MNKKRVVVTGIGTVNPLGNSISDYWNSLIIGESGIDKIDRFDVSEYTTQIAGFVKGLDLKQYFDPKEARRTSNFVIFAYAAAKQAMEDSGLTVHDENVNQIGVEIGSGIGGIEVLENMTVALNQKGPSKVSPFTVPMMIIDMASGFVSIKLGLKGPNSSSVSACASANHAMGNAFRMIQEGTALAMVTGGAEAAISPIGLASFCAARSLSKENDSPQTASRPFDANRTGFVMGEGSGILVFEEYEHAKKRGAHIYAEIIGFGSTGDAYHITAPAPEGEGASRAMQIALDDAKIEASKVDYINAHGTSTVLNDKNETMAIKRIFGDAAYDVSISSTKSMTGHLLGAAGAIELIASIKAIESSIIPPTINLNTPDPECDLNYTPNKAVEKNVDIIMSNSLGFGGHNAVILAKKPE